MDKRILIFGLLILFLASIFLFEYLKESGYVESANKSSGNELSANTSHDYEISIIDNSTGGDIRNNTVLNDTINQTPPVTELIEASKNGTPMITFGNGSRPRVMIVAGVHGGELPPQIAATQLVNDLNGKRINGTIYIIPFAIPRDTATSTRIYNNTDPNRVANIPGTPVNKILRTSKNKNITLLLDCHSTRPNDIPGKNCIIYDPKNSESLKLALYLQNKTRSDLVKVGDYQGVLSTACNSNNITSVTCEVLSPHNKLQAKSDQLSYKYMKAFLDYAGVHTT